eukprot:1181288-Amphidinium_carterae.1
MSDFMWSGGTRCKCTEATMVMALSTNIRRCSCARFACASFTGQLASTSSDATRKAMWASFVSS